MRRRTCSAAHPSRRQVRSMRSSPRARGRRPCGRRSLRARHRKGWRFRGSRSSLLPFAAHASKSAMTAGCTMALRSASACGSAKTRRRGKSGSRSRPHSLLARSGPASAAAAPHPPASAVWPRRPSHKPRRPSREKAADGALAAADAACDSDFHHCFRRERRFREPPMEMILISLNSRKWRSAATGGR